MKRVTAALLVLAVLAACFIGGASAYMDRRADDLEISGEALCGDAAAAEGFTVGLDAILGGHVVWNARYSPATGDNETDYRWSPGERKRPEQGYTTGLDMYYGLSGGLSWSGTNDRRPDSPLDAALYDAIAPEAEANMGETVHKRVRLNDYTDVLPIMSYPYGGIVEPDPDGYGGYREIDWSDVFNVPLPGTVWVSLSMTRREAGGDFNINSDFDCAVYSSSAVAADGNLYLALMLTDLDGAQLDASGAPGGSWGLYRIQGTPDEEPEGARWWMHDPNVTIEPEKTELVTPVGGDCTALNMFLSYDGQYLQLVTCEGGEMYFTVVDITSGETLSREQLPPPFDSKGRPAEPERAVESMGCALYEDFAVFSAYDTLYVYEPCDGDYELRRCIDVSAAPVSVDVLCEFGGFGGCDDYNVYTYYTGYAWDGEKLAVLKVYYEYVWYEDTEGQPAYRGIRPVLSVYGEDGSLAYCEIMCSQLDSELSYRDEPLYRQYVVAADSTSLASG